MTDSHKINGMYKIEDRNGNPPQVVTTTDATPTVIDSFTLEDGHSCIVVITVVATESGGGNRGATQKMALIYRDGGGATIQGAVEDVFSRGSNGSWALDITVSGNDVNTTVTGIAATTITWKSSTQFLDQ